MGSSVESPEFRVLGRVEALRAGGRVAVGRSAALNLLAGLLLSPNSAVPTYTLAEIAWGQALPSHPQAALHTKISRLRHVLGDGVIETVGETYCLRTDADHLDLLRFEGLMSQASAAPHDAEAAAVMDHAIGLWRGDPLANIDSPTLTSEAVPRLTERYLMACEQWAQASLRLGRAADVVPRLVPLMGAYPFREPIVRLLMLALCHDERKAEALRLYDSLRRRLAEELGTDPGAALQELHVSILRGTLLEYGSAEARSARLCPPVPRPVPGRLARADEEEPSVAGQAATTSHDEKQFTELRTGQVREVRVALDPFITVLALTTDALGRRRGAPQAWRKRILDSLSAAGTEAILPITAPRYSVTPDCVTPLNPAREIPVHIQVEWLHSISKDDLLGDIQTVFDGAPPPQWQCALRQPRDWVHAYADAMADAWRSVMPLWTETQPMLEREIRRVGAAVVRGGLDLILDRLHPACQFDNHVLRIRDPEPTSVELGDRPLVLVPMLSGFRALICNLDRPDAVWIAYPLPMSRNSSPQATGQSRTALLESMVGPTPADVLTAAGQPLTISALAVRSGVAWNKLAYHCGRLAAAGLVQQEKISNEVWISQTERGAGMVELFSGVL
jgi:DNA-binding SARP family transcriptional activator